MTEPPLSDAALEYLHLWDEVERLWEAGRGESPEADELRDRMDRPWFAMRPGEHERIREMRRREQTT